MSDMSGGRGAEGGGRGTADSGAPHYRLDRGEDAVERRDFLAQSAAASGSDRVIARTATSRRRAPLRREPTLCLQPLEGGVERTLLDGEDAVGKPLDVLGDRVTVHRLHGERLEDEHVERPFEELVLRGGFGHGDG